MKCWFSVSCGTFSASYELRAVKNLQISKWKKLVKLAWKYKETNIEDLEHAARYLREMILDCEYLLEWEQNKKESKRIESDLEKWEKRFQVLVSA